MPHTPLFRNAPILGQFFLKTEDPEAFAAAATAAQGDTVTLEHETENTHDTFAALVRLDKTGTKLGYIAKEYSPAIIGFLNAGCVVRGTLTGFTAKNPVANVFIDEPE